MNMAKVFIMVASLALAQLAQAADYVKLAGAEVDFYYDASVWGSHGVSISGNSITFGMGGSLDVSTTPDPNDGPYEYPSLVDGKGFNLAAGLVVVAHHQYALNSSLTLSLNGAYANGDVSDRSYAGAWSQGSLLIGDFSNGVFSSAGSVGHYLAMASNNSYRTDYTFTSGASAGASSLAISGDVGTTVYSANPWGASAGIGSISYDFSVIPLLVPEPQTWGMLLAGLALTGAALRRRQVA